MSGNGVSSKKEDEMKMKIDEFLKSRKIAPIIDRMPRVHDESKSSGGGYQRDKKNMLSEPDPLGSKRVGKGVFEKKNEAQDAKNKELKGFIAQTGIGSKGVGGGNIKDSHILTIRNDGPPKKYIPKVGTGKAPTGNRPVDQAMRATIEKMKMYTGKNSGAGVEPSLSPPKIGKPSGNKGQFGSKCPSKTGSTGMFNNQLANQAHEANLKRSGYVGSKGVGTGVKPARKGRFVKGSQEAKDHMAMIRAKKG
jgi:hypothetical protein